MPSPANPDPRHTRPEGSGCYPNLNIFISGCGGHITGFSGAISTPQYPYKDSHSLRCEWLLAVPSGNKVPPF